MNTPIIRRRISKKVKPLKKVKEDSEVEAKENQTIISTTKSIENGEKKGSVSSLAVMKRRTVLGELSASEVQLRSLQHSHIDIRLDEVESDEGDVMRSRDRRRLSAATSTVQRSTPILARPLSKQQSGSKDATSLVRKSILRQQPHRIAALTATLTPTASTDPRHRPSPLIGNRSIKPALRVTATS